MKKIIRAAFLMPLFAITFFSSCSRKNIAETNTPIQLGSNDHSWYYFPAEGGVSKIDLPQNAPVIPPKPWTEAVRISSAACALGNGQTMPAGYAVVNRRGILVFGGSQNELVADASLFASRTAGNIVFQDDVPLFSLYKSSFFNDEYGRTLDSLHPFLVQFDTSSKVCYPLVSCANLSLSDESEITDFVWDGTVWLCSVKKTTSERSDFSYISWQAETPLLSLSPADNGTHLLVNTAKRDDFRALKEPQPFSTAPKRLKRLIETAADRVVFQVVCYTAGGHSPRSYTTSNPFSESDVTLSANACLADTWAACLFQDGTFYITGALYDRQIMNNSHNVALRLPKLPAGYMYTDFTISGTSLYAAWEESSFYQTGRAGFLLVDLDSVIYGNRSL